MKEKNVGESVSMHYVDDQHNLRKFSGVVTTASPLIIVEYEVDGVKKMAKFEKNGAPAPTASGMYTSEDRMYLDDSDVFRRSTIRDYRKA